MKYFLISQVGEVCVETPLPCHLLHPGGGGLLSHGISQIQVSFSDNQKVLGRYIVGSPVRKIIKYFLCVK